MPKLSQTDQAVEDLISGAKPEAVFPDIPKNNARLLAVLKRLAARAREQDRAAAPPPPAGDTPAIDAPQSVVSALVGKVPEDPFGLLARARAVYRAWKDLADAATEHMENVDPMRAFEALAHRLRSTGGADAISQLGFQFYRIVSPDGALGAWNAFLAGAPLGLKPPPAAPLQTDDFTLKLAAQTDGAGTVSLHDEGDDFDLEIASPSDEDPIQPVVPVPLSQLVGNAGLIPKSPTSKDPNKGESPPKET